MKNEWRVLAVVCVVVVGVYEYAAYSGFMATPDQPAAGAHYNQLVQGFRAGQLNLKVDVPAGLAQLANPYDPTANAPYRTATYGLNDLSYYKGKLYLYFGVTPALLLFWPFVALTGHYLYDGQAVVIFCALGFLVSVGILCALRRRYFPDVSIRVVAAGALALGLATGVPTLLPRSNVNEVAISCAYMLTMLALGAIYGALHQPDRRWIWLAAASAAYGLAVGARPTLVFGAIILLAPVMQARRERRPVWPLLLAATAPIALIGLGLMLYNARRFGNPFEFGLHYQLCFDPLLTQQLFDIRYLWFNFRVYFLEPLRWGAHFPFVQEATVPSPPAGYDQIEAPYGVLTCVPLVWLALAVPLAWRDRPGQAASALRRFGMVVAVLFGICALTTGLYNNAIGRYEVDFLPGTTAAGGDWRTGFGAGTGPDPDLEIGASFRVGAGGPAALAVCGTLDVGPAVGLLGGVQPAGERRTLRRRVRKCRGFHAGTGQDAGGRGSVPTGGANQPEFRPGAEQSGKCPLTGGQGQRCHRAL